MVSLNNDTNQILLLGIRMQTRVLEVIKMKNVNFIVNKNPVVNLKHTVLIPNKSNTQQNLFLTV